MSLRYMPRAGAEHALAEYIFPVVPSSLKENEVEESIWTDRLLTTMKFLNEKALSALISFSGLKIAQVPPCSWLFAC
jgi:sister-chromatid-cohesion protein PDS5